MPVEVVRCQQRQDADRGRRRHVRSLEARELDDKHIMGVVVVQLGQGTADIAGKRDVEPIGTEGSRREHRGGRLALGSGHGHDSPVLEVLHEQRRRSRHHRTEPGRLGKALVVSRDSGRADDEVETAIFEDRWRLHIELGQLRLDRLPRTLRGGEVPHDIVDDDKLRACRADAPGEGPTFNACPEHHDPLASERRDTSDQRHAAMVHRRS